MFNRNFLLFSDTESEQKNRPENAPPTGDRLHLCDPQSFGWIDLSAWYLAVLIAQSDDFETNVNFHFIFVKPGLLNVNRGVVKNREMDGSKSVGGIRQPFAGSKAEQDGVDKLGGQPPIDWHVTITAARKVAGTLNKCKTMMADGVKNPVNFVRPIFIVAGHKHDDFVAPLASQFDGLANRGTDSDARAQPIEPSVEPSSTTRTS